jgi:hypothetical protein
VTFAPQASAGLDVEGSWVLKECLNIIRVRKYHPSEVEDTSSDTGRTRK